MTTQHTSGPWRWEHRDNLCGGKYYCDTVIQVVLERVAGGLVTDVTAKVEVRSVADKALIAAAPDMFAALEALLNDEPTTDSQMLDWGKRARVAYEKAKPN